MGVSKVSKPDLFKQPKQAYLDEARAVARKLLARRDYITSEDVTALCPLPRYLHKNLIGHIMQHPDFEAVGYAPARRPSSNGRVIRKWTLTNPREVRRDWYHDERDTD